MLYFQNLVTRCERIVNDRKKRQKIERDRCLEKKIGFLINDIFLKTGH